MSALVRRPLRWLATVLVSALLFTPWLGTSGVRASVVTALGMGELVREAEQVLVVTALSERARREAHGGLIVTDVRLRVEETLKGDASVGGVVVATRLGGALDKVALQVPGEASFTLGERALVFLRRHTNEQVSELRVVGMAQGVLPLRDEAKQTMVMPSGGDVALVARDEDGQLVAAPSAMSAARPLSELRDEIRRLVTEQAVPTAK